MGVSFIESKDVLSFLQSPTGRPTVEADNMNVAEGTGICRPFIAVKEVA
jgi:hypothetical protein